MTFAVVHVGAQPGDVVQEVLEHLLTVLGVQHLGVELHAGAARGRRSSNAATGAPSVVAVTAKPSAARLTPSRRATSRPLSSVGQAVEQRRRPVGDGAAGCRPNSRQPGLRDVAAERERHRLEAVADAEHRDAGVEQRRVDLRAHRRRRRCDGPPERMMAAGSLGQHLGDRHRVRHDLAVDVRLAHPAGDQLRVLRTEVDDEDGRRAGGILAHLGQPTVGAAPDPSVPAVGKRFAGKRADHLPWPGAQPAPDRSRNPGAPVTGQVPVVGGARPVGDAAGRHRVRRAVDERAGVRAGDPRRGDRPGCRREEHGGAGALVARTARGRPAAGRGRRVPPSVCRRQLAARDVPHPAAGVPAGGPPGRFAARADPDRRHRERDRRRRVPRRWRLRRFRPRRRRSGVVPRGRRDPPALLDVPRPARAAGRPAPGTRRGSPAAPAEAAADRAASPRRRADHPGRGHRRRPAGAAGHRRRGDVPGPVPGQVPAGAGGRRTGGQGPGPAGRGAGAAARHLRGVGDLAGRAARPSRAT